jgi:hypothetical protein
MRSGIDHFPKLLSYYDFERDRVEKILMDVGGSGSDSKAAATAIDQSIKMKLGDDVLQFLSGQTTDSGGGGVLESLKKELALFERVSPSFYLILPCTLHGLQRSFHNAMILVLGEGGLGMRNLLQLVHSCFDLQQCFPGESRAFFGLPHWERRCWETRKMARNSS